MGSTFMIFNIQQSVYRHYYYLETDHGLIHMYSLSPFGKMCIDPIRSESRCRTAAEILNYGKGYVLASGDGHDLPYGCVLAGTGHIFWNPEGVALSNDYTTRTICYTSEEAYDGKYQL